MGGGNFDVDAAGDPLLLLLLLLLLREGNGDGLKELVTAVGSASLGTHCCNRTYDNGRLEHNLGSRKDSRTIRLIARAH